MHYKFQLFFQICLITNTAALISSDLQITPDSKKEQEAFDLCQQGILKRDPEIIHQALQDPHFKDALMATQAIFYFASSCLSHRVSEFKRNDRERIDDCLKQHIGILSMLVDSEKITIDQSCMQDLLTQGILESSIDLTTFTLAHGADLNIEDLGLTTLDLALSTLFKRIARKESKDIIQRQEDIVCTIIDFLNKNPNPDIDTPLFKVLQQTHPGDLDHFRAITTHDPHFLQRFIKGLVKTNRVRLDALTRSHADEESISVLAKFIDQVPAPHKNKQAMTEFFIRNGANPDLKMPNGKSAREIDPDRIAWACGATKARQLFALQACELIGNSTNKGVNHQDNLDPREFPALVLRLLDPVIQMTTLNLPITSCTGLDTQLEDQCTPDTTQDTGLSRKRNRAEE